MSNLFKRINLEGGENEVNSPSRPLKTRLPNNLIFSHNFTPTLPNIANAPTPDLRGSCIIKIRVFLLVFPKGANNLGFMGLLKQLSLSRILLLFPFLVLMEFGPLKKNSFTNNYLGFEDDGKLGVVIQSNNFNLNST